MRKLEIECRNFYKSTEKKDSKPKNESSLDCKGGLNDISE